VLAPGLDRCFSRFEAADGLFEDDTFFDLRPPFWRFQLQGLGDVFAQQLRSVAEGPDEIEVLRTIPCATGFISEHLETKRAPRGVVTSRRIHLCDVRDGRISAVTSYCNGG
jgi:hypothetical protein